ncbi:MAG: glycosyl transferase family 4 [Lacunisphaera sp.]|nr:glycosyl transferase family 4 [Lacunisphaera sp.]
MAATISVSFVVCAAIIAFLLRTRLAWLIATDVPNSRSLHAAPVPRVGGWGLVPAALIGGSISIAHDGLVIAVTVVLFVVSYADDRLGLPILLRLSAHAAVAALWLAAGPLELPIAVAVMAAFAMVWITNLFNFMDGADGLAGGMALFAFGVYAAVAVSVGVTPLASWSAAIAAASAGFLLFNFSPARVFLGDAGSVTIGFFAGAFGIWGWAAGAWPVWFPFLVSAPFFLDATVTILRRMISGESFWQAHREHYYQRLIRSGWTHRRTALCEYLLMAASAGLAVAMLGWVPEAQYAGLAAAALVYVVLAYAIDRRWTEFRGAAAASALPPPVTRKGAATHKPDASRITTQQDGFIGEAMKAAQRTAAAEAATLRREQRQRISADERVYEHDSERR